MLGVVGDVFLVERYIVSLAVERFENGSIRCGMSIAPRRGNGEPEDGDLHPLLQQQISAVPRCGRLDPGSRLARAELLSR